MTYPIVVTGENKSYTAYIIIDGVEMHYLTSNTKEKALNKAKRFMKRICPYCYEYVSTGDGVDISGYYYHHSCLREIDYN